MTDPGRRGRLPSARAYKLFQRGFEKTVNMDFPHFDRRCAYTAQEDGDRIVFSRTCVCKSRLRYASESHRAGAGCDYCLIIDKGKGQYFNMLDCHCGRQIIAE